MHFWTSCLDSGPHHGRGLIYLAPLFESGVAEIGDIPRRTHVGGRLYKRKITGVLRGYYSTDRGRARCNLFRNSKFKNNRVVNTGSQLWIDYLFG